MRRKETRRAFCGELARTAALVPTLAAPAEEIPPQSEPPRDLNGTWLFRLDPLGQGEAQGWHRAGAAGAGWSEVRVPHTWQVDPHSADYMGPAWYHRVLRVPASWAGSAVRVEFEAAYHTATVWVNGHRAAEHAGKGYTPFTVDLTPYLRDGLLTLAVRVDNSFDPNMLPRDRSFDWSPDGGIYRPVNLLVTPQAWIDRIDLDATPTAGIFATVALRNVSAQRASWPLRYRISEPDTGRVLLMGTGGAQVPLEPGEAREAALFHGSPVQLTEPHLWHFDDPYLYRFTVEWGGHAVSTMFGMRSFEAHDGSFYLNGERVRLMGVERMAGSNPRYGMAEPLSWIGHDHRDLKELNCVFTRVHWPQDRRVLDFCDRHGILIQEEVPAWGPRTFPGMGTAPAPAMVQNGLEQLRELIRRDRNHPAVCSWGLCNEVNGQNPAARRFIEVLRDEARKLDPHRLLTYASNSLRKTPERDAAGLLDFISWNEYYESWYGGGVADMRRNLEEIHRAFPGKPVVISEYGFCECTPKHAGGDLRRAEILRTHDAVFREFPWVGGAIFFDYNDYRTFIGDKGTGPLKQRVHGVVDLFGKRKPSFQALRAEASPVAEVALRREAAGLLATVRTRGDLPSYTLSGYRLRWVVYANGGLPMEEGSARLPRLKPGAEARVRITWRQPNPDRVAVDVMRPTGFSAAGASWPE